MVVYMVTIEVCRVEVYSVLFAVCARFILFVVVCSACFLIMQYRENNSSSCLLVVHIEVIRRGFAPVFYSSILQGIISSCVVVVLVEVYRVEVYSV